MAILTISGQRFFCTGEVHRNEEFHNFSDAHDSFVQAIRAGWTVEHDSILCPSCSGQQDKIEDDDLDADYKAVKAAVDRGYKPEPERIVERQPLIRTEEIEERNNYIYGWNSELKYDGNTNFGRKDPTDCMRAHFCIEAIDSDEAREFWNQHMMAY